MENYMENIILGLLYYKGRTIYELKLRFESSLSMMYSSSTGSIQSALKKLLRAEEVERSERYEGGRLKKLYTITPKGRERFISWVNSPFEFRQNKNPELAKLYFAGQAERKGLAERIGGYAEVLKAEAEALDKVVAEGERLKQAGEAGEVFVFQLLTVKYNADMLRFEAEWFGKAAKLMEQGTV